MDFVCIVLVYGWWPVSRHVTQCTVKEDRSRGKNPLLILMEASLFIRLNEDSFVISGCPMPIRVSGDDLGEDDVMAELPTEAPLFHTQSPFHTLTPRSS